MIIFFIIIFFRKKNYWFIINYIFILILYILIGNFIINEKLGILIGFNFIKCRLLILSLISFLIIVSHNHFKYSYIYILLTGFIIFLFIVDSILLFFWVISSSYNSLNFNKRLSAWTSSGFFFPYGLFYISVLSYFTSNC